MTVHYEPPKHEYFYLCDRVDCDAYMRVAIPWQSREWADKVARKGNWSIGKQVLCPKVPKASKEKGVSEEQPSLWRQLVSEILFALCRELGRALGTWLIDRLPRRPKEEQPQ